MIRWINDRLGTAPYGSFDTPERAVVVDVRALVDASGNTREIAMAKVDEAAAHLGAGRRVIVCCDHGISRSNSVAAGALARAEGMNFTDAIRAVVASTGEGQMHLGVLSVIREGLEGEPKASQDPPPLIITGATGMIGTAVAPKLSERMPIVAPTSSEIDLLAGSVGLDLLVKETGAKGILHLAHPRIHATAAALASSLLMLKTVLDVCHQNQAKLFYVSNWEIWSGYRSDALLANEELAHFPGSTYGEGKMLCEVLIEDHRTRRALDVAVLRSTVAYGAGDKPKFIHHFTESARKGQDLYAHRLLNGHPKLDLLHLDDLSDAVVAAIDQGVRGVLNLGTGALTSTTEIAEMIIELVGSRSRVHHLEIDRYASNIQMDTTHARSVLDWRPRVELAEGLARMIGKVTA